MSDVFIAYKREDQARAQMLRARLNEFGVSTWLDAELEIGVEWRPQIAREIACARAVIVCWTHAACLSAHVEEEARAGLQRGILAPVRFDDCTIPAPLAAIEAADLRHWSGAAGDPALSPLLARLEVLFERPVRTAARADAA